MLNCPSCGAPLPLRSAALAYATCEYCRALVLREGQCVQDIGKVAAVPFDVSPLQLRTRLWVDSIPLTLVGRVRWGWEAGSWNEWLALGDDGEHRWVGEAMGQYLVSREAPALLDQAAAQGFAATGAIALGDTLALGKAVLAVTDIKQAHCLGADGDLPFAPLPGRTMSSVDLRGPGAEAIALQRDADGTTAWAGRWYELAELTPRHLRAIDGWTIPEGMA